MTPLRLAGRLAATFGIVALTLSAGEVSAATQMFKCIIGGRTVYQQQACPVSADAAPSAGSASGLAAGASTPAGATAARRLKPASRPASSAPATRR
ncbi:MAG: hypothetical protein ABI330_11785 [Caldimonas sp.]